MNINMAQKSKILNCGIGKWLRNEHLMKENENISIHNKILKELLTLFIQSFVNLLN